MKKMETIKEEILNILKPLSLSAQEMAFWEEISHILETECPEQFALLPEMLELMTPGNIRFLTQNSMNYKKAAEANDRAAAKKIEEEADQHWIKGLEELLLKDKEARYGPCLKKAQESLQKYKK